MSLVWGSGVYDAETARRILAHPTDDSLTRLAMRLERGGIVPDLVSELGAASPAIDEHAAAVWRAHASPRPPLLYRLVMGAIQACNNAKYGTDRIYAPLPFDALLAAVRGLIVAEINSIPPAHDVPEGEGDADTNAPLVDAIVKLMARLFQMQRLLTQLALAEHWSVVSRLLLRYSGGAEYVWMVLEELTAPGSSPPALNALNDDKLRFLDDLLAMLPSMARGRAPHVIHSLVMTLPACCPLLRASALVPTFLEFLMRLDVASRGLHGSVLGVLFDDLGAW